MTTVWGQCTGRPVKPSNSSAMILPLEIKRGNKHRDGKENENEKNRGNRKEHEITNEYKKENENEDRIENANSKKKENTIKMEKT
jgi:hypothetical protein